MRGTVGCPGDLVSWDLESCIPAEYIYDSPVCFVQHALLCVGVDVRPHRAREGATEKALDDRMAQGCRDLTSCMALYFPFSQVHG